MINQGESPMTTDRNITDARAAELARLIEATRVSVGPLGHDDDTLDDLAAWLLSHGENLLADRAADRAEIERLEKDLRTVQNAAISLHKARDTELRHLKENATFDHRLRAQVESLQERDAQMTDALLAAERERDEARAEADRLRAALIEIRDHWPDDMDSAELSHVVSTVLDGRAMRCWKCDYTEGLTEGRKAAERERDEALRLLREAADEIIDLAESLHEAIEQEQEIAGSAYVDPLVDLHGRLTAALERPDAAPPAPE